MNKWKLVSSKKLWLIKKKKNLYNFQWASVIYTWTYVQEDKQCTFLILWNKLQVSRNAILNIWTAPPLLYCRIFLITTRFSGILMTDWVKITKNIPHFLIQKHYCFSITRFAAWRVWNLYHHLYHQSICINIHIDWVWRWQSITVYQKGSNTRYLERLRIDEEYVSTVQRPNEDYVSHRLY